VQEHKWIGRKWKEEYLDKKTTHDRKCYLGEIL
jgi:hypothetical protein